MPMATLRIPSSLSMRPRTVNITTGRLSRSSSPNPPGGAGDGLAGAGGPQMRMKIHGPQDNAKPPRAGKAGNKNLA